MSALGAQQAAAVPEQGNLVRVRGRFWVVKSVVASALPPDPGDPVAHHAVELVPIDAEGSPDSLTVFWEVEPGTEVRPQTELPDPADGLDDAETFGAFLDAVRWGAIASADPSAFQAPFRAGIEIEDYQLLPLVKALEMPRVTMLIADDVGLGKTIEAGLIAEELVLRGQARKILVVCPPSLCGKWQREMREKFGLAFEVVDTAYVRRLRRERGVSVNPFQSHPRLIVSMDWVKFEQQMRWFDEFLPADSNTYPRAFDLLIVDEAHQIAPAAVGRYAKDSLRTQAMRRLAPHFEHRLFLTATPHNGYRESFESLLETLDPNRFAKGVEPSARERDAVMVRRLKSHLRTLLPDGDTSFPDRRLHSIDVDFATPERTMFRLLDEYAAARRATAESPAEQAAARCIILLLKKRLLSSPMAFKRTLDKHIATLNRAAENNASTRAASADRIEAAQQAALEADADGDDSLDDIEQEALALAASALPETAVADEVLLARLRARAISYEARPRDILNQLQVIAEKNHRRPDAKTERLLEWIGDICFPDGEWNDERVIVFTEYRDTLQYLHEMLTAPHAGRPDMRGRVEVFHGAVDADERERIIREFNYDPATTEARVLIATDVAAEGIDLHRACHRLVHADVPFNPNRMEQRNGRVDRHGQRSPHVDLFHFAGATNDGPDDDPAGFDHSFLLRVAQKIDEIRDDLGAVSPVLAERIEARMLRERDGSLDIDAEVAARRDRARIGLRRLEQDLIDGLADVRRKYRTSLEELELSPASIERAVGAGLRISNQPALRPLTLDRPTGPVRAFEVPDLSGMWGELLTGLYDEVIEQRRPVTFDAEVAAGHDDVAYLHVAHPFVARCLRALRAQVWGAGVERHVNRFAVRCADVEEPVAVGYARVVVNGADGSVLDEVIEPAAIRVGGRQGRLNVGETRAAMRAAHAEAPPDHVRDRYVDQWPRVRPALTAALKARAQEVQAQRERRMDDKRDREARRVRGTLEDLRTSIHRRLEELASEAEAEQLKLFLTDDERRRFDIDVYALRVRLDRIDGDIATEVGALEHRYDVRDVHWFPVAVEVLVPVGER
ncbi:MAG: DISARM system SNF2-like helicase DrmD [bacterium]|nr:DISARM system SNF2-like helicase DrmD [bacterium]